MVQSHCTDSHAIKPWISLVLIPYSTPLQLLKFCTGQSETYSHLFVKLPVFSTSWNIIFTFLVLLLALCLSLYIYNSLIMIFNISSHRGSLLISTFILFTIFPKISLFSILSQSFFPMVMPHTYCHVITKPLYDLDFNYFTLCL